MVGISASVGNWIIPLGAVVVHASVAVFVELINIKKQKLFSDLGLSSIGKVENIADTLEKIQQVLLDEAKKRDYPMQSVEALNAVALVGVNLGEDLITGQGKSITLNSKEIQFLEDLHSGEIQFTPENKNKMNMFKFKSHKFHKFSQRWLGKILLWLKWEKVLKIRATKGSDFFMWL